MSFSSGSFQILTAKPGQNYYRLQNSVTSQPVFIYRIDAPLNVHTGYEIILHLRSENTESLSGVSGSGGRIGLLQHPMNDNIYHQAGPSGPMGFLPATDKNIVFPRFCPYYFGNTNPEGKDYSAGLEQFNALIHHGELTGNVLDGCWFGGTAVYAGTPYIFCDNKSNPVYYNLTNLTIENEAYWHKVRDILLFDKIIHLRYVKDYMPFPQFYNVDMSGPQWRGSTAQKDWWVVEKIIIPTVPNYQQVLLLHQ